MKSFYKILKTYAPFNVNIVFTPLRKSWLRNQRIYPAIRTIDRSLYFNVQCNELGWMGEFHVNFSPISQVTLVNSQTS